MISKKKKKIEAHSLAQIITFNQTDRQIDR